MNSTKDQIKHSTANDGKPPVIASTAMVVDLDSLANVCGFFNGETPVNNHYGCNHKDCSETELVRVNKNGEHERKGSKLERQILMAALRKKYGSWGNIEKASKTKSGIEFIKEIKHNKIYDQEFVEKFGCKRQGKCYSFSCPIATQCDLEYLKEYDTERYNDWKDEEYDPSECGADLMLVTDENLIEALS